MDAGSTDGTVEILAEFAHSHPNVLWHSEPDGGQSDALNKALALVDTAFFGWLNADDCYFPKKIEQLLAAAESKGSAAVSIVYGDYIVIDAAGRTMWSRRQPTFNRWDCLYSYLTVQNGAAIFNSNLTRKSGGFETFLRFCMDYDLILKLAKQGRVVHVRDYIGMFRHHEMSKTSTLSDVCADETQSLRLRYANCSEFSLHLRYYLSKMRVAFRMARENCLASRFRIEI
jgi:GT2 family glycosyltransferase